MSTKGSIELETLFFRDRDGWETWLRDNHAASKGIWMLYYRKGTEDQGVSYKEALEEAIRYGWIDSIIKRLDEGRYVRKFTPRCSSTSWSKTNLNIARRLISEDRMTPSGLEALGDIEERVSSLKQREMPTTEMISSLFQDDPQVRAMFDSLPKSHRRHFAAWIFDAKREETRLRRTKVAAHMIREGRPPLI